MDSAADPRELPIGRELALLVANAIGATRTGIPSSCEWRWPDGTMLTVGENPLCLVAKNDCALHAAAFFGLFDGPEGCRLGKTTDAGKSIWSVTRTPVRYPPTEEVVARGSTIAEVLARAIAYLDSRKRHPRVYAAYRAILLRNEIRRGRATKPQKREHAMLLDALEQRRTAVHYNERRGRR